MIEDFDNENLNEPQNLRIIFRDMSTKIKSLKKEMDALEENINSPDNGLKMNIKEIQRDIDTLDKKLTVMTEQQSDTRKTVKNVSISAAITAAITAIVTFVMKQIGLF